MLTRKMFIPVMWIAVLVLWTSPAFGQVPHIVSTSPAQNELNVSVDANISVTFNVEMDAGTISESSFVVFGDKAGFYSGNISYDGISLTAQFEPDLDFAFGERLTVVLAETIESAAGIPMAESFCWSFTAVTTETDLVFYYSDSYEVPWIPNGICSADFDGDGNVDIASTNGDAVSVALGNGDGTFADAVNYAPAGGSYEPIIPADFDNDGAVDLATISHATKDVEVLMNNGDGTFAPAVVLTVPGNAYDICVDDFDGDGFLDIAAVGVNLPAELSVLINAGDGTFLPPSGYDINKNRLVCSADVDNDGDFDLVAASLTGSIAVVLNQGDGTFVLGGDYDAGPGFRYTLAHADFNSDGIIDIVVGKDNTFNISVLLGTGGGSFGPAIDYETDKDPRKVLTGDINGDGHLDILSVNTYWPIKEYSILLNYGDGTFLPPINGDAINVGTNSATSADFDNDSDLDFAFCGQSSPNGRVLVLLNDGYCN